MNRTIDGMANLFKRSLSNIKIASSDIEFKGDISVSEGNILLEDDQFIKFGENGGDMSIGHDPNTNLIAHSLQLQFRSQMTSGDSYKFLETLRRTSTWVFSTDNDAGAEKSNAYMFYGNDDTGATNSTFLKFGVRAADNSGLQTPFQIRQEGNTIDTAMITHFSKTTFENDILVKDGESIFLGDSNDMQLIHDGSSYVDEQGGGNLYIRTNGDKIALTNLTDNSVIAQFNRLGSSELWYNGSGLKLETKTTGIDVTGVNDINSYTTDTATGWNNKIVLGQSINTNRLTTITIDLESNKSAGNGNAVGIDNGNATYLARVQTSTTGIVYKIEASCIEAIAGGAAHLALYQSTTGTYTHNQTVSGSSLLDLTNSLAVGDTKTLTGCTDLSDDYIYLVSSTGSDSTSLYTAGKLIIKLYGSFF